MRYRCPQCGYNLKKGNICPYCKITIDQMKNASHIKAKECLKNGEKDKVVMSSCLPKDINHTRLILITIIFGILGVHNFYVSRPKRGFFFLISFFVCMTTYGIYKIWFEGNNVAFFLVEITAIVEAIAMAMWMSDIVKVISKNFTVPVVLEERVDTVGTNDKKSKKHNNK